MNFHIINMLLKYAKNYGHSKIHKSGVNDTEHKICALLYFHNSLSQDMVSSMLLLDKTTVAKALLALEKRELITREQNPNNRRKYILNITNLGKETISDIVSIYDEWLEKVESCLSINEKEQFHTLCNKLLDNAKQIEKDELKNELH